MKFANIIFNKRGEELTIGDDLQLLAIENLYLYMGIDYQDVVRIERTELQTYDGEYVILPISFPFVAYYDDLTITCFSEKIIPIFLGFCVFSKTLCEKDVAYLKRFAPIGCRDEYTLNTMKKYNIPAYLNGCMTLTFPKEVRSREHLTRIFCIDVQEELIPFIPKDLLPQCEFSSHSYISSSIECNPEEFARNIYMKYRNEARLVITSRLHAAIPCMAAGIPVIFAKDIFSYRFAGVDKFIQIYDKQEFGNINWNPLPIDYEGKKSELLQLATKRILNIYNEHQQISVWNAWMQDRQPREWYVEFMDNSIEYIKKNWPKDTEIEYALWGITQVASNLQNYIQNYYPKAKLRAVVDRDKRISIYGLESSDKNILRGMNNIYVFICTGAAVQEAKSFLPHIGIENYYNCCEVISKTY
ncbi:polysaccharide pyruvyl transferase family protein [Luxibacter massiliensis]|uniref:polysaccharide pyruvyl transferase family protein n=1 Tax=Luxibacter massiliensis TaxID=2219695 RepID=UPI000F06D8FA|nr:polysaccharide pyruvyl transferase family protein [Luxibacter massiliensis]